MKRNAVFIIFDTSYYYYAKSFIETFFKHNDKLQLYCFVVNPTPNILDSINKLAHVVPIKKTFESGKNRINFIVTRRFSIFNDFIKKNPSINKVLMVDCDALIKKNLEPLFKNFDVILDRVEGRGAKRSISGGLCLVSNNAGGRAFLDEYSKQIKKLPLKWYQDQYALYYSFEKLRSKLSWSAFEDSTQSTKVKDDIFIYQARGRRRKENWNSKLKEINEN